MLMHEKTCVIPILYQSDQFETSQKIFFFHELQQKYMGMPNVLWDPVRSSLIRVHISCRWMREQKQKVISSGKELIQHVFKVTI